MIAGQKEALEAARRSREDALKATKVREDSVFVLRFLILLNPIQIKSNFLASMSHELRTPFRYNIQVILKARPIFNYCYG